MDRGTDERTDSPTDRDGQTDGQTGGQMDGQTDKSGFIGCCPTNAEHPTTQNEHYDLVFVAFITFRTTK